MNCPPRIQQPTARCGPHPKALHRSSSRSGPQHIFFKQFQAIQIRTLKYSNQVEWKMSRKMINRLMSRVFTSDSASPVSSPGPCAGPEELPAGPLVCMALYLGDKSGRYPDPTRTLPCAPKGCSSPINEQACQAFGKWTTPHVLDFCWYIGYLL